jgi:exopolysaccharide production protein ExoQ
MPAMSSSLETHRGAPRADAAFECGTQLIRERSIWRSFSTWGLLLLLLYFAVDGVSPFSSHPVATRAVETDSAGGIFAERFSKLLVFLLCMTFVVPQWGSVRRFCGQMKLATAFPLVALLLFPVSQMPTRTVTSSVLLLGGILLMYYVMARYTFDQMLELLLVLGVVTIVPSIVLAVAFPEYGLDAMGGHTTAWKGIFSAKNYLGNMALFFLTIAVSYRGRTVFRRFVRVLQILFCLTAIAFSHAATGYILTALYVAYFVMVTVLHRLRKKDYFALCFLGLLLLFVAVAVVALSPDFLYGLLGKESTLTGRTEIWRAAMDSIAKRPLLGYGYQAFWLGLEGESYHVILAVSWLLAQAQNGFVDVTLEMGLAGLGIVLLVFGFAFRDAAICLFRSRDGAQLHAVEWYFAIVMLTFLWNMDESFLFEPKHLGSMIFLIACAGLKIEWKRLKEASSERRELSRPSIEEPGRPGIPVGAPVLFRGRP